MPGVVPELVLDTSVVVKFFVQEPDSAYADDLLERFRHGAVRFVIPDFLFIEFANVLWRQTVDVKLTEREAEEILIRLLDLTRGVEIVPAWTFLGEVFRASCKHAHAAYDAGFLALAKARAVPFLTADVKLYHKARPHYPQIMLLRDFRSGY